MDKFLTLINQYKSLGILESINYGIMNDALISHHSTAIEGSSLTEIESRLLITEGITAKGKPITDQNMVLDHHEALEWVIGQSKLKRDITPHLIQEIAAHVMRRTGSIVNTAGGSYDISKGDWRKSNVFVGERYFMSPDKIEREVIKLCNKFAPLNRNITDTVEIYSLAFDVHYALVSIHPFGDGNGRTSRLLMNYVLSYHNEPLANIFKEDKLEYYTALEMGRTEDGLDYQPIRDFMFAQQEKYLSDEIRKFQQKDQIIDI